MTSALRTISPFTDALFSGTRRAYSSQRWLARQTKDTYSKQAKVLGYKSRAAFKLLEINEDYKIFKKGDTVVDLVSSEGSHRRWPPELT
jgi:21S rRNA (uridine2791-2'-O)-methyltransferase